MKRLIWFFLLASAFGQTFNTNIIPAQTGLSLGRQGQRWNLYASNLDITGAITVNGVAGHFTIFPLFGSGHTAVSTDLTSSTPGQCAFWIAGNMLGQGPCLTAVPTPTLGDCAIWSTTTTLSSLPCAGGGGSGDIKSLPVSTQTITQPKSTTLAPNNLQQVRYATNYQWSQSPTSPATIAIGANTVTINGVLGVNAYSVSKVKHYLWIATQGTPERVLITATTCTGVNTGTCTVTFTAAGTHSAGYTLGTATGGWQEAWVDAFPVVIPAPNPAVAAKVAGSPTNNNANIYTFNAPLDIDMAQGTQAPIVFDGQGSAISCNTSGLSCIDINTGTGTTGRPIGVTLENFLFIPASGLGRTGNGTTKVIYDKGQGIHLSNIAFGWMGSADYFDDLVVIGDDQLFSADHINVNPNNGPPLLCDTTYCGSAFKASPSAVGSITNSDLSMACKGNGVDWASGNTLHVSDSVVQAFSQFGVRALAAFSVNPSVMLTNVYDEVGSCNNPLGTGAAGLIVKNGWATVRGSVGPVGKVPSFTASAVGATQFNYYVVAKSSTLGTSNALLAGFCLSNGTGTCTVKFNQVGTSGTMTWDLIRTTGNLGSSTIAPYTAGCAGGSVAACGSVATGVTTASCSNNVCTVSDDITANSTSYTVLAAPTFFPVLNLWPGAIVLGPSSDTSNIHNGSSTIVHVDQIYTSAGVNGGIVSTAGRRGPSVIAGMCPSFADWSSGYAICQANYPTAGVDGVAEIKHWGGTPSKKGRTIYALDPVTSSGPADLTTYGDSNPALTAATPGNRGANDVNDTAIGLDQASGAPSTFRLGYRAPVGHRWYVGSFFDNSSWKMQLSTSGLSLASLTGSTQCLHADTTGLISGTGSDCGSGAGSGNVSNSGTPTSGQIPVWQSATTISGVTNLTLPGDVYAKGRPNVDVRAYGAVGNNSTDDTTAIQNAIAAAANLGTISSLPYSAELFLPCGNYLISAPLILPRSTSDTNANGIVKIRGESKACVWITASAGFPTQRAMIEWDQTASHRTLGQEISGITFKLPAVDRVRAIHYQYTASNTPITTGNVVAERMAHLWLHDLEFQGNNQYQDYHIYPEGDCFHCTIERVWVDDARATGGAINNVYESVLLKTDTCFVSTAPWSETCGFNWGSINELGQIGNRGGYSPIFQGRLNQTTFSNSFVNGTRGGFANSYGFGFFNSYSMVATNLGNEGLGDQPQFLFDHVTQSTITGIYPGAAGNEGFGVGDAISFVASSQNTFSNINGKQVAQQAFNLQQLMTSYSGLAGGSGYSSAPTWTTTGGNCTVQPSGTTTLSGAAVATLVITNGGNCQNIPAIAFSGGGGSGASASATMSGAGTYYNVKLDANSHQNTFWDLHQTGTADVSFSDTSTNFAQSCDQTSSACATYFSIGKRPGLSFASPTVDSFANATHSHSNAAGGGQLTDAALSAAVSIAKGGTGTASTLTGLVRGSASAMTAAELSGDATTSGSNAVTLASRYKIWEGCNGKGLGDGLNATPAGTYLEFSCVNITTATVTLTGFRCYTDNAGTSTMNAANNAGTGLLTGAVTCNNTKASGGAAGTQSATVTLAAGDAISFTMVFDGTSKQMNITVSGTY